MEEEGGKNNPHPLKLTGTRPIPTGSTHKREHFLTSNEGTSGMELVLAFGAVLVAVIMVVGWRTESRDWNRGRCRDCERSVETF